MMRLRLVIALGILLYSMSSQTHTASLSAHSVLASAPPAREAADIQQVFLGTWSGSGVQSGGSSWTILLTITGGSDINAIVGTIAYPSLACGGELSLLAVNNESIELFEDITYGTGRCVDGGTMTLSTLSATELDFQWDSAYPPYNAHGQVSKISSGGTSVASKFSGVWRGATSTGSYWTVLLGLDNADVNSVGGAIAYPSLRCGGVLTLVEASATRLRFSQNITYGSCVNGLFVTLDWVGAGLVQYAEMEPAGTILASGSLQRISPSRLTFNLPFSTHLDSREAFLAVTTSIFDHNLPLGFGPDDGNNIVTSYLGVSHPSSTRTAITSYDQHNGYDFSARYISDRRVRAPANGTVTWGYDSNTLYNCSLNGVTFQTRTCMATIDHGDGWETKFLHLAQVEGTDRNPVCRVDNVGQPVQAGDPIGNVGSTGCSTASHIHMQVLHNDIIFDPSGWQGTAANPDPWALHVNGAPSSLMWSFSVPSLEQFSNIQANSGAQLTSSSGNTTIHIPPGSLTGVWSFQFFDFPIADPENGLLSTGNSFFFEGSPTTSSTAATQDETGTFMISIHYSDTAIQRIKAATLQIFWWNETTATWEPLPTVIDQQAQTASAATDRFGQFALLGEDALIYIHLPMVGR